ncbi:uncharacterized protein LOC135989827 [Caloenas nicobarica]|uniref:uncharacterized protein LOC135989827 n=1 Tax=Caloenas nicobarica TaxID=187106 RepID=UPI0032B7B196
MSIHCLALTGIGSSQGKPCVVPPQSLMPFFVEVEKCFRAMSDAFSTQPAQEPLQLQVPTQQDASHRRAKQQSKVLLTHCSASAYLRFFGIAGRKPGFKKKSSDRKQQCSSRISESHSRATAFSKHGFQRSLKRAAAQLEQSGPRNQQPRGPGLPQHLCCAGAELHKPFEVEREISVLWKAVRQPKLCAAADGWMRRCLGSDTLSREKRRTEVTRELKDKSELC